MSIIKDNDKQADFKIRPSILCLSNKKLDGVSHFCQNMCRARVSGQYKTCTVDCGLQTGY